MRKKGNRASDARIIKSSGNVFEDLGFDPAEAAVMAMRAELMIQIEKRVKAQGWTQAEAAEHLGITQPRVSQLMKGAWREFRMDMLLTLANRAGLQTKLKIAA